MPALASSPRLLLKTIFLLPFLQSMIVSGLQPATISTVMTRFDLSAVEAGVILATYDVAVVAVVLPLGLHVCHLWPHTRLLGAGFLVMAAGAACFALPHFLSDEYDPALSASERPCLDAEVCAPADAEDAHSLLPLFLLANALVGVGAAPVYTLGPPVIEDVLGLRRSQRAMGVFYACSALGPALGFALSASALTMPTEFDGSLAPASEVAQQAPSYVGNWWLPFLGVAAVSFAAGLLLLFALPTEAEARIPDDDPRSVSYKGAGESAGEIAAATPWSDVRRVLRVRPFVCVAAAVAVETLLVSGVIGFLSTVLESQYALSASSASFLTGAIVVPGAAGGMLLGGVVAERSHSSLGDSLRFCVRAALVGTLMVTVFAIGCESPAVVVDGCADCHCAGVALEPVCGGGATYFSPCHAGCEWSDEAFERHGNCSCSATLEAVRGACADQTCGSGTLALYCVALLLAMAAVFANNAPGSVAIIRSVPPRLRPSALAINSVALRVCGSIPGPIIFGALVDGTCVDAASGLCSERRSCQLYDAVALRHSFIYFGVPCKALSAVMFMLAVRYASLSGGRRRRVLPVAVGDRGPGDF